MRPRITDRNIWLVFATIFLVGLAYGLSISVVSLFLDARHFHESKTHRIAVAVWFALGIVALSLPMGALIRRFSARRTLVRPSPRLRRRGDGVPFMPSYGAIAVIRFFDSACSVGVWVCCETILLSRTGRENKAYVTSLYAIAIALGYVIGPLLSKAIILFAPMSTAFVVSGVLSTLAGAPRPRPPRA